MNEAEREQLAQRLSALSFNDARKEVRKVDPAADLKYFRNTIWDEYHTLFVLPTAAIRVALVEKKDVTPLTAPDTTRPPGSTCTGAAFTYVEARVTPLDRRH